jgi:PH and SEC7 domain-containing protein
MLLNTDLHDTKILNKMTLPEFIENLKGLNNGSNFPDALLESLYSAIKKEPLECANIDGEEIIFDDKTNSSTPTRNLGSNPFLQMPDPNNSVEYKSGWLLRKCCVDQDGKRSAFLKRSWKMFYASLRDMVLYLHKDDKCTNTSTFDNITNAIRIHHALATVATDYKKKQFVFRLKTAEWAEYLFQTSNSNELFSWVTTINHVAAMFSSPPMPGGVGSSKTFQRPLLPVAKTRYTIQEQYEYHKKHLKQLNNEIVKLESAASGSSQNTFDKDKYNYLKFEVIFILFCF